MSDMSDQYLWLEDVSSEESLNWVKSENERTLSYLKSLPIYKEIFEDAKKCYEFKDVAPYISVIGDNVYNFWQDEKNSIGLLRRMKKSLFISEYSSDSWETVLDFDLLSEKEEKKWVYKGFSVAPNKKRILLTLSPGGTDSSETREFDLEKREFVKDGFFFPKSKGWASWITDNQICFQKELTQNDLTTSGYPRRSRIISRGESLAESKIIHEIPESYTFCYSFSLGTNDYRQSLISAKESFFEGEYYLINEDKLVKLDLPSKNTIEDKLDDLFIITVKTEWMGFYIGDLVAVKFNNDGTINSTSLIFRPKDNQSIESARGLQNEVIINLLEDVKGRICSLKQNAKGGWSLTSYDIPEVGNISSFIFDRDQNDFFTYYESYNKPRTIYQCEIGNRNTKQVLDSKSLFDHEDIEVTQKFATSKDGTQVPYFLIHKKGLEFNSDSKTIINAYGGFEVSRTPFFNNIQGKLWLERGNVYVVANIRGGGEYGPKWHKAGLKQNRHKVYEDFFAVCEMLIADRITSPLKLAAIGGSNGGLLMGVCQTQRPELFKAICCQVPLLDMLRFHKLLAGASWIAEYGDPENEDERMYLSSYSPYHNIDANESYPRVFFTTSTKDDRVHPAHARKMAAKMKENGQDFFYFENLDGGHAGSSSYDEYAQNIALIYTYFHSELD